MRFGLPPAAIAAAQFTEQVVSKEVNGLKCALYYSQIKTAKAEGWIFRSGKERPCRLAGGKSMGLDAARAEKTPAELLD